MLSIPRCRVRAPGGPPRKPQVKCYIHATYGSPAPDARLKGRWRAWSSKLKTRRLSSRRARAVAGDRRPPSTMPSKDGGRTAGTTSRPRRPRDRRSSARHISSAPQVPARLRRLAPEAPRLDRRSRHPSGDHNQPGLASPAEPGGARRGRPDLGHGRERGRDQTDAAVRFLEFLSRRGGRSPPRTPRRTTSSPVDDPSATSPPLTKCHNRLGITRLERQAALHHLLSEVRPPSSPGPRATPSTPTPPGRCSPARNGPTTQRSGRRPSCDPVLV